MMLHSPNPEPSSRRILLIDDDRCQLMLIARYLEAEGYEVETAEDGESGLEATQSLRPEVVLCDWMMPGINGVEYCRQVKSDPDLRPTYIALITALSGNDHLVEALDAGADDFLVKPVEPEILLARIRAGMRSREVLRQVTGTLHRSVILEMAATLGHQINNPLTGILGHLELAATYLGRGELERARHHLEEAGKNAHRIGRVSHRLMAMADPKMTTYLGNQLMLDLGEDEQELRSAG